MEGLWKRDLVQAAIKLLGRVRAKAVGPFDTTKNLTRSLVNQIAVLYDRAPLVQHADPMAVEFMNQQLEQAGMWQMAISMQQTVLVQRESAYRFDVPESNLLVRIVPQYLLWAESSPDNPDVPVTIHEYRIRTTKEGKEIWTRDVLSIVDPASPVYRVESVDGKTDLSGEFLEGSLSGDAYPYRFSDGTPFLPFVLYHATRTGKLWDPFRFVELIDGTVVVAVLWSFWQHLMMDASWPQRWGMNVKVPGLKADGETASVVTDPASILLFEQANPAQPGSLGQFQPGGDPQSMGESIRDYSADLAGEFDLSPADIQRTHTDARSGHAIEISREGQRAAQRRFEPQFKRGDVQSLSVIAALLNRARSLQLPESDWGIKYRGLPLGMEERKQLMEEHKMRAELGVTSKPRLLAQLEGMTLDQARETLREIAADNAEFDTQPPTTPDPSESE